MFVFITTQMQTCPKCPDESPEFWSKWKNLLASKINDENTLKKAATEFATLSLAHIIYLHPESNAFIDLRDDDGNYIDSEGPLQWTQLTALVPIKTLVQAKRWAYHLEKTQ